MCDGLALKYILYTSLSISQPDSQKCKAFGEGLKSAEKHLPTSFYVHLVNADGDTCVGHQEVTAELKSLTDSSATNANTKCQAPDIYQVSYQPSKCGNHELSVKVNNSPIQGSPFMVFVKNSPSAVKCTASGAGLESTDKHEFAQFTVHLVDEDGDSCVIQQIVMAELISLADGSVTQPSVVCKTPATYLVYYRPNKCGEHQLIVKVNEMSIQGSPFTVLVKPSIVKPSANEMLHKCIYAAIPRLQASKNKSRATQQVKILKELIPTECSVHLSKQFVRCIIHCPIS